jgi:FkbM family methyltransferase
MASENYAVSNSAGGTVDVIPSPSHLEIPAVVSLPGDHSRRRAQLGFTLWLERRAPALAYYTARVSTLREAHEALLNLISQKSQRDAIRRWGPSVRVPRPGVEFSLDLRNAQDFQMFREMAEGPGYEPGTTDLLLTELHEGSNFVDVGANNGYYTTLGMSRVGTSGHVWSFEPNPSAFERLSRNVTLNGAPKNVELFPVALGSKSGTLPLFISRYLDSRSSFTPQGRNSIQVRVARADEILGDQRIDFIKIDAEGAEHLVLEGLTGTLERNPGLRLIVEWTWRYSNAPLWQFLRAHFRRITAIRDYAPGGTFPVPDPSKIRYFAGNLVCDNRPD